MAQIYGDDRLGLFTLGSLPCAVPGDGRQVKEVLALLQGGKGEQALLPKRTFTHASPSLSGHSFQKEAVDHGH